MLISTCYLIVMVVYGSLVFVLATNIELSAPRFPTQRRTCARTWSPWRRNMCDKGEMNTRVIVARASMKNSRKPSRYLASVPQAE